MVTNFGYSISYILGKTRDTMDFIQGTLSRFITVTTDQLDNDY